MSEQTLRVHQFLPSSCANGPGARAVLWVQGCSLACPGCFNPETHAFAQGELLGVEQLFTSITELGPSIEGITLTGGEPLQQRRPLLCLLEKVRTQTSLSVVVFTGYTWSEVQSMPQAGEFLRCIDILLAGRYVRARQSGKGLIGSAHKTIHFLSDRYSMSDLEAVPEAEIIISPEGEVMMTGIAPVHWGSG